MVEQVIRIAQEAGQAIMDIYQSDFDVTLKGDQSPLTQADLASHNHIVQSLEKLTPDIPVLSEESKAIDVEERKRWHEFWLVDPLDGTKEFIKRNGEFTVNIALIRNGKPILGVVHAPVLDISYWGVEGRGAFKREAGETKQLAVLENNTPLQVVASRSHANADTQAFLDRLSQDYEVQVVSQGSSLKLCLVAEGAAQLYPRLGPTMEWDTAAAHCVVEQAGGKVLNLEKEALRYNKDDLLNPYFFVGGQQLETFMQYHAF